MTHEDAGHYAAKHDPERKPVPAILAAVREAEKDGSVNCAIAHKIAGDHGVTPAEAGFTIDFCEFRIARCQLGLFGYSPARSIVKPAESVTPELEALIRKGLENERLPCATAWGIAAELGIPKMAVSSACETLGIRIKPCQLGAF